MTSQKKVVCRVQSEVDAALAMEKPVEMRSGRYRVVTQGNESPVIHVKGSARLSIESRGSSWPVIVVHDGGHVALQCDDTSRPLIKASGTSRHKVVAYGHSEPALVVRDEARSELHSYDNSRPIAEVHDRARSKVLGRGASRTVVIVSCEDGGRCAVGGTEFSGQSVVTVLGSEYEGATVFVARAVA